MDPIHPIIPQSPTLPSVAASAQAQSVNRDGARSGAERERRRRRAAPERAADPEPDGILDGGSDDEPDEPRSRIDITA
jgi:hypothetical protein